MSFYRVNDTIKLKMSQLINLSGTRNENQFKIVIVTLTSALCRYKLCGMMTAPITPTACNKTLLSQFSHHGVTIPLITSVVGGAETTYCK